jgi:dUTP pyrophosphatase
MKYKRLYLDSPSLDQREPGNAGFDLKAYEDTIIEPESYRIISTGIAVEIPIEWLGLIVGRSGLRFKNRVHTDDIGVIDSNYRGEVKILLENDGSFPLIINAGDRIAQLILVPCYDEVLEEVKELSSSNRGELGFGSTGLKELSWN